MRATPVNLIGGFYADDTRPWSVQDTVNWLPVAAEVGGTLTPSKLSTPPGLKPYQKIGTGPIRGMYNCEGQMFAVSGRTMYRISNAGIGIPVGTIPGVGRVSISHNQFKGGNQVLVTNGSPGGGYVYDTQTQQFNRISDPGFPGSLMTAYVDSYLLGVEPQGRFWFHSNLADANDYNTLDRYEAEAAPDRIVGLAVSQFEVWTFGERTTECFGNAGGATGTFQSRRTSIERGCASRWTIQNLDNSIFWLGDDGIVYRLEGYGARRVSTVPLERAIAANRLQDAFAFTWEDKGHKVYYLTMADGHTWGYDVVSGIWHRRESYGLNRWRLNDSVRWNGAWYGGDFQDGRIWRIDWEYPAEGDQPMVSERTSPVMHDAQSAFNLTNVELIVGVGQEPVAIAGDFPAQPPMPEISGAAPDGVRGREYTYTYAASGGTGTLRFSIIDGPSWITIDQLTGLATFRPTTAGSQVFKVRATDENGMWAELTDTIVIDRALMAVATPNYTYNARGGVISDAVTSGMPSSLVAGSLSITPNAEYLAGAQAGTPYFFIRKANADGSAYLAGPALIPDPGARGWDSKFSEDGTMLAVAYSPTGSNGVVSVYSVNPLGFERIATTTLPSAVHSVGWCGDGRAIAIGLEPNPDGGYFAILPFSGESFSSPIYTQPIAGQATVVSIRWNDRYVAGASGSYSNIWEWKGGILRHIARVGVQNQSNYFEWLDGGFAICGSSIATGTELATYGFENENVTGPFSVDVQPSWGSIGSMGVSSDRKYLALGSTAASSETLFMYHVNGITLTAYDDQPVTPSDASANSLVWTPSGL